MNELADMWVQRKTESAEHEEAMFLLFARDRMDRAIEKLNDIGWTIPRTAEIVNHLLDYAIQAFLMSRKTRGDKDMPIGWCHTCGLPAYKGKHFDAPDAIGHQGFLFLKNG